MMERVSSQLTIFLRIALPTIWITTLLSLAVLLGFAVQGRAYLFSNPIVWIGIILILGTGIAFIRLILWRVYRVDMDNKYVYVSDYFKTYKYSYTDIEHIRDSSVLPGRIFIIRLKSKGSFGREIAFLASQKLWQDFITTHPEIFKSLYPPQV
jgi:hypothetical protein